MFLYPLLPQPAHDILYIFLRSLSVFAMPLPYRISIGSVEITAARGLG